MRNPIARVVRWFTICHSVIVEARQIKSPALHIDSAKEIDLCKRYIPAHAIFTGTISFLDGGSYTSSLGE